MKHPDIPSRTFADFTDFGAKQVWCAEDGRYADELHESCQHQRRQEFIRQLKQLMMNRNGSWVTNVTPEEIAKMAYQIFCEWKMSE